MDLAGRNRGSIETHACEHYEEEPNADARSQTYLAYPVYSTNQHQIAMTTVTELLLANLEDALKQTQRYLLAGALAAGLLFSVTLDVPRLTETSERVELPAIGALDPAMATYALMIAYVVLGVLAAAALRHAQRLAASIDNRDLAHAALRRLSIATTRSRTVRLGSVLLAPALFVAGYLVEKQRLDTPVSGNVILGLVVLSLPYLWLLLQLWNPISAAEG